MTPAVQWIRENVDDYRASDGELNYIGLVEDVSDRFGLPPHEAETAVEEAGVDE